jgi:hypothetical protein
MIGADFIRRKWRSSARMAMFACLAATLAACAMIGSEPLTQVEGYQCESGAGAYFLPKTLLQLDVVESGGADPIYTLKVRSRRVADPRFGFCLDYLARASGDDVVTIKKYKDAQILGEVATDALDQSRFILQTLIQTAFVVASGNPKFPAYGADRAFRDGNELIVLKAEVDPFDAERTAEVNQTLKDFGFCLALPGVSFEPGRQTPDAYCESPLKTIQHTGAPDLSYRHVSSEGLIEKGRRRGEGGVFYRPRLPHPVQVMVRDNPKVPKWRLGIATIVKMENVAPIINVDIDRTYFAQRKTHLKFNEGMLSNVCVKKGSELLAVSYIPLQVVQSIVALPGEILKVRINDTNNQAALVKTEKELLRVQREQIAFLKNEAATTAPESFREQKPAADLPNAIFGPPDKFALATRPNPNNDCQPDVFSGGLIYEPIFGMGAAQ